MNILFICKHNIFRSKVAEAYFKKINRNSNHKAQSSGLIIGRGLTKEQASVVNLQKLAEAEFGIKVKYGPKPSTIGLLRKQDLIIITADDIPLSLFNNHGYVNKIVKWNIPDVHIKEIESMKKSIKKIIAKVDSLVKEIE